LDQHS